MINNPKGVIDDSRCYRGYRELRIRWILIPAEKELASVLQDLT